MPRWLAERFDGLDDDVSTRKLIAAGVPTTSLRVNGIIHDFMMLNPLRETAATTVAIETAIQSLRKAFAR